MQFKRIKELKPGMRLARPIYNKNGVLLYERDSKLSPQGIASIQNFGLIGLFILEPAEPVPPMSEADIEFERFQSVNVFSLQDELERIATTGRAAKLQMIVSNIIRAYGHLEHKVNFIQNLRSEEDFAYKHALNVGILCAMLSKQMNLRVEERLDVVTAALLCNFEDYEVIDKVCSANPNVRRYCAQADKIIEASLTEELDKNMKIMTPSRVLAVARVYDNMTAMSLDGVPESEVATIRYLMDKEKYFSKEVVEALIHSVNILVPGICVELNTGEKALVLTENTSDMFRPMVLGFDGNDIIDLGNRNVYGDLEIKDVMKTLDNRYVIDTEMLSKFGMDTNNNEGVE